MPLQSLCTWSNRLFLPLAQRGSGGSLCCACCASVHRGLSRGEFGHVVPKRAKPWGTVISPCGGTVDGIGKGWVALWRPCAAWSYFCPRCEFPFHVAKVSGRSFGVLVAATLGSVCSGFCSLVKQGLKPVNTVFDRLVSHASIDFEGYPQWV